MKRYPKIPRHDHPVIEDFFEEGEVYITEKYDGTNFRFALYEERFQSEFEHSRFAETVTEMNPSDGELVFGTKTTLRGTSETDIQNLDGNLRRIASHLREAVDVDEIRSLHNDYGPLIFFCEGMVYHTIDYGYTENPPPALIGFDVYAIHDDSRDEIPAAPYEEDFEGFLETKTAFSLFKKIGIRPAADPDSLELVPVTNISLDDFEVPSSSIGDIQAEGVVFRKDDEQKRAKYVTELFKEMNKESWGLTDKDAETGAEKFVARFCSANRIRKNIHKMVTDEGREFSRDIINDLYPRVIEDIWQEEWREIKDVNFEFNPSETKPIIAQQCAEIVKRMEKNSALNDAEADELWRTN